MYIGGIDLHGYLGMINIFECGLQRPRYGWMKLPPYPVAQAKITQQMHIAHAMRWREL